ncbi:actin-depolymerizing factor 1, isoforms a/b-like [Exaiptasia diaphana]|uniref:ADF-H domain-containing protein n=1 Tax=Exaiptasia diaphana TaxID=2652724 RepID=A0A913X6R1_EXADI|nr:actin-depolymerizing factor 1, isoforms a/b-like [Exaiptasia diaphana]
MVKSNIKCDDSVKPTFDKMTKGKKEYRYIIFKIENNQVVVDKTGDRDKTFQDMINDLPEEDAARYVVFDLTYRTKRENQLREKIVFLSYCPSGTDTREKMLHGSTALEMKEKLGSSFIHLSKQCDDLGDMNEEEIKEEMATKG